MQRRPAPLPHLSAPDPQRQTVPDGVGGLRYGRRVAGLSFDDGDDIDPAWTLDGWLDEWLDSLGQRAARTRSGYLSDAGSFAVALAEVRSRDLPRTAQLRPVELTATALADLGVQRAAQRHAVAPGSYLLARDTFASIQLGDLAPRHAARALNRYAAGGGYRRPGASGNRSDASVRRAAAAWSNLCRYLVGQQVLASNPMRTETVEVPAAPRAQPRPFDESELQLLLGAIATVDERARAPWPARDFAVAATFLSTGVRLSELITARREDFTGAPADGWRLRVVGKGAKGRTVPVHPETADAVVAYLEDREQRLGAVTGTDVLFVRADGTAFTPGAMRALARRWCERAGVSPRRGATVHAWRHSFATIALDAGATAVEVQQLLGHESLEPTRRYLAVVGQGLHDAIRAHPSRRLVADARDTTSGSQPPSPPPPWVNLPELEQCLRYSEVKRSSASPSPRS